VADDFVRLVRNQDAGREHGQVLGPAAAHCQADPFSAFEQCVGDGADRKRSRVREVADVCQESEQKLDDEAVPGVEVELVLRVGRPLGEEAGAASKEQPDCERDEDDRLDDPLDDDDFDEGVVLAAHAAELSPESGEVVGAFLCVRWGHLG